jgi:general secretion pathway protein G
MTTRVVSFSRRAATERGYTFIELLVVTSILLILASAVMPLAQVTSQRQREADLRRNLRELRTAIDAFKNAVDLGRIPTTELEPGNEGYPPDLETLVDGISAANDASGRKLRFLRRIPINPLTGDTEWGLRSYQDSPTSTSWGGQNVFDVYSGVGGTALDGTDYQTW